MQLRENIWVCLVCGHIGCGRYSFKHAERHYQESKHVFSLELATGRIWQYDEDTFVHFDSRRNSSHDGFKSVDSEHNTECTVSEMSIDDCLKNYSLFEIIFTPSIISGGILEFTKALDKKVLPFSISKSDWILLDFSTREKIQNLVDRYESLLLSQLNDQKLYFEKKIAKLSVESFGNRNESTCDHSVLMTGKFKEFAEASRQEMGKLELFYLDLLRDVCEAEKNLRYDRREIDAGTNIMNKILSHNDKEVDLMQQCEDIRFYNMAQKKVKASPMKDELLGGDLVIKKQKNGK